VRLNVHRLRTIVSLAASVAAAATACTSHSPPPTATALQIVPASTPRFVVGYYDASGVYPQVRGQGLDLHAVNAALRRAIRDDQRRYVSGARGRVNLNAGGSYRTTIDPRLVSASTTVVSAMLRANELYPNNAEGSGWIGITVRVPSGRRVRLEELFCRSRARTAGPRDAVEGPPPRQPRACAFRRSPPRSVQSCGLRLDPSRVGRRVLVAPRRLAHPGRRPVSRSAALSECPRREAHRRRPRAGVDRPARSRHVPGRARASGAHVLPNARRNRL
jgi:hypothetical protein